MQNFISTADAETAEKMKKEGFVLVDHSNGFWTFINKEDVKFDEKDKVRFTNQLHI